ncbi:MAG: response regulator [Magnetococcales bacterium]|nr:response regulator [Magnetococcales bacterium]
MPHPMQIAPQMNGLFASQHLLILEDPDRSLTLADLTQPATAARFQPGGKVTSQGITRSAWWVRVDVVNPTDRPISWLLQALNPLLDYLDLYHLIDDHPVEVWHMGDHRPFSARPIPFASPIVPLETPARTTSHIYLRYAFQTVGIVDTEILLWTPTEFAHYRDWHGMLTGCYTGSLLFMALYNLFIFIATRMRAYLWYVVYMGMYMITGLAITGEGHRFFYTHSAWLTELMPNFSIMLSMAFAMQFNRTFLNLPTLAPRTDRFFILLMTTFFCATVLILLGYKQIALTIAFLAAAIVILCLPLIGGWLWWRGYKGARLLTMAWAIVLTGAAISLGRFVGYVPTSHWTLWSGRLGIWIEAILLSLALADQINILRQEKDQATQREREAILLAKNELESKVTERTLDLQVAKQKADAANQTKSLFLANISHEIRTPMNAIIGTTHLVLKTPITERQQKYLLIMQNAAHLLLQMINDILDFSKFEAGELKIERIPFHLHTLIEKTLRLMEGKADEKGLEFLLRCHVRSDLQLIGDPLRLQQILLNLLANAIKFTHQGEISLGIEPVHETPVAVRLRFWVQDSGIGISQAQINSLFQPFSQADISHARKYGGTGLGLALSQRLATVMSGIITVESEIGMGSTFSLTIPFEISKTAAQRAIIPVTEDVRSLRILLVDDHESARTVLSEMLESFAFEVTAIDSGFTALKLLEESTKNAETPCYDLILLDCQMPHMDGLETARRIHAEIPLPPPPTILMVSACQREEVIEQAESMGLAGYLHKPVTPSELFDTIMGVLGGSRLLYPHTIAQAAWNVEREEIREIQGARVLLVDDIPLNQEIAQEFLEGYGLIVTRAGGGQEAITQLQNQTFDLLLMDIQMPDMNGLQATQAIRHQWPTRRLPIIAMTAHALADDRRMCLEAGMDDYITKPIDPRQLLRVLSRWIQTGAQATDKTTTPPADHSVQESLPLLPTELPGIHLAAALQLVHGNQRVMYHSLTAFRRDYADIAARIEKAWRDQQPAEAKRLLHTIKGLAGNMGMVDLHRLATRLDAALRQDQADRTLFIAFSAEMNRVIEGLNGLGTRNIPPAYSQQGFDLNLFESQCQELFTLLAEGDFTAPDRLPVLADTLRGRAVPLFAQLEAQTMAFATTEAMATLKTLQQAIRQQHRQPSP